ncbi:MAG: TIGR00730 family Rossman fold protein [bacterium]
MKAICVYCGSSPGIDPRHREDAAQLGRLLAEKSLTLVYGGGRLGLMGRIADAALQAGGKVLGVIPESLRQKELAHLGLSEIQVVQSMHERKAVMAERSDAFLALPGGFGTLDEMMEIITWTQLGFQQKPIGFLNRGGFYDPLFHFIRQAEKEGFIHPRMVAALRLESSPETLLDRILAASTSEPSPDWPRK